MTPQKCEKIKSHCFMGNSCYNGSEAAFRALAGKHLFTLYSAEMGINMLQYFKKTAYVLAGSLFLLSVGGCSMGDTPDINNMNEYSNETFVRMDDEPGVEDAVPDVTTALLVDRNAYPSSGEKEAFVKGTKLPEDFRLVDADTSQSDAARKVAERFFALAELYRATGFYTYRTKILEYKNFFQENDSFYEEPYYLYGAMTYMSARHRVDVGMCTSFMNLLLEDGAEIAGSFGDMPCMVSVPEKGA